MRLDLTIERRGGRERRPVEVAAVYNLGSAVRDMAAARAHQEEVERAGIANPRTPPPWVFPLAPWALVTDDAIAVQGPDTSGEVEIAMILADELYVGVGSDHTDRALERFSVQWSKQVCPNVLAPVVWPWAEIAAHWDRCVLSSAVDGRPYQRFGVDHFLPPPACIEVLRSRVPAAPGQGIVLFSGTHASLDATLKLGGARWSVALEDPALGRAIRHDYTVSVLLEAMAPAHRIPLANSGD